MKTRAGIAILLVELVLLPGGFAAQESIGKDAEARLAAAELSDVRKPKTVVQDQLSRLIREEAGVVGPIATGEGATTDGNRADGVAEGTLELEPMIVDGKREITLPPPLRENKVQEILRTGTLWERVGPRFTKRFWLKGDRGIGFTLSW